MYVCILYNHQNIAFVLALFAAKATDQIQRRRKRKQQVVTDEYEGGDGEDQENGGGGDFNTYLKQDIAVTNDTMNRSGRRSTSKSIHQQQEDDDSRTSISEFLSSRLLSTEGIFHVEDEDDEEEVEVGEEKSHITKNVRFFGVRIDLNGGIASICGWVLKYTCVILIGE
jgi:hypothetical protein